MNKITKRVKIITGEKCNARCRFCYYYYFYISKRQPSSSHIKWELRYAKRFGLKDVDFSGGEPTVRSDLPELISYAKSLGFRRICIVTNGLKLSDEKYLNLLVESGLNEILFSVHGHNQEINDYLTQVPGHFEKLIKAIKLAKDFGLRVRTNTTITKVNCKYLPTLSELLMKFEPVAINFIKFNPWSSAYKLMVEMAERYSTIEKYVKKSIDILKDTIPKVTVRYIPFCFMVGYEKHVCDCQQVRYDPDEWLPWVRSRLERDFLTHWLMIASGSVWYHPFRELKNLDLYSFLDQIIVRWGQFYNTKIDKCRNCKYFYICDGVEKLYLRIYGSSEIKPVEGTKIRDPMKFRRGYADM